MTAELVAHPTLGTYGSFLAHSARTGPNSGTRALGRFDPSAWPSADDSYLRNPAVHGSGICQSVQTECTDLNSGPPRGSLMLRVSASRLTLTLWRPQPVGVFLPMSTIAASSLRAADGRSRRIADVADPDRGCLNWADSAPTTAASGTTAVRTIAVIELRARNSLHRP
jgi:hypothetical protein